MTIDLNGGTGFFDRMGSIAKTINDLQANYFDALETRLIDLQNETLSTQQIESSALMGRQRELQVNAMPTFDAFFQTAREILIRMADDDAQLSELTIQAALEELLEQMEANNEGLAHTEPSSSISETGLVTGSGKMVVGLKDRFGEPLKHVFGEVLRATVIEDGQEGSRRNLGNEIFLFRGEQFRERGDPQWIGGSGSAIQMKTARGADDAKVGPSENILTNSDWEQDDDTTADLPRNWVAVTGAAGTRFLTNTTDQLQGDTCLEIVGDGSTLTEIKQGFGLTAGTPRKLKPLTLYACGFWMKRDGTPAAAGDLRVRLQDNADNVISVDPEDGAAIEAQLTVDLTALTTSYVFSPFVFVTPPLVPATMHIALELTTALTTGRSVFLDELIVQEMVQVYSDGPYAAFFRGATDFVIDDFFDATITQNDTSANLIYACNRLLGLQELGKTIPTLDAPTISDGLIV